MPTNNSPECRRTLLRLPGNKKLHLTPDDDLISFFQSTALKPLGSVTIMHWAFLAKERSLYELFPLLEVDPITKRADHGDFRGMRNPETNTEWISALLYVISTTFAQSQEFMAESASLRGRLKDLRDCLITENGATLGQYINQALVNQPGAEVLFWTRIMRKAYAVSDSNDEGHRTAHSSANSIIGNCHVVYPIVEANWRKACNEVRYINGSKEEIRYSVHNMLLNDGSGYSQEVSREDRPNFDVLNNVF